MKQDIKNYTYLEFKEYLARNHMPGYIADQIFHWLYKKGVEDFERMSNLSGKNRLILAKDFCFSHFKLKRRQRSGDGCEKFLFDLGGGCLIETVFLPEKNRNSLCLSSQVGCRYNCRFCLSGEKGFKRNLSCAEIVNQYLEVARLVKKKISNILFMGTGEPLDNFKAAAKAINIFTSSEAIGFSPSRLVVSTCGLAPQIIDLGRLNTGVKLSVSLHAAEDPLRSRIMPVNKKYPLSELMRAVNIYARNCRFAVTFEYVLIDGVNSSRFCAQKLARLARRARAKVNLIAYNQCSPEYKSPSATQIKDFEHELEKQKVTFTFRKPRGRDIMAACGQLRAEYKKQKDEKR